MKAFFLFTILLFISNRFRPIFSVTTPRAYTNFITKSCRTTTYPSHCNIYLSPYATKVKTDPLRLCTAALTVSLQAAKNSTKIVSAFSKLKGISKSDAGVIKDCIYNVKDSVDELKLSIKVLSTIRNTVNKKFKLASIKTYVSAAITDEETCLDELNDSKVNASVKRTIKVAILNFERITSNALYLINRLKL